MNKNILLLPFYTLIAGIILHLMDFAIIRILIIGTNEFTLQMGTILFWIRLVSSILMIIVIGLIIRRKYSRVTFFKSTSLMVIYSVAIFAFEQIALKFGIYSFLNYYIYLPVDIFTFITLFLTRISTAQSINWMYAIPSILAPYIFMLFSKSEETSGNDIGDIW